MAKYDRLALYLRSQSAPELALTFTEIEQIINATLPCSAREQPAWWRNDLTPYRSSVQSRAWVGSGYGTYLIDFEEQRVTFRKKTLARMKLDRKIPRQRQTSGARTTASKDRMVAERFND